MSRAHDLGGLLGLGYLPDTSDLNDFESAWEIQIFAIVRLCVYSDLFSFDQFRDAVERLDSHVYLSSSYFERWVMAVERLCAERDFW